MTATNKYTSKFKALSDLTRLRALRLVLESGGDVCVCELVDSLGLPQYQVSKHLSVLKQAGLVLDERVGTWVHYSVPADVSEFVGSLYRLVTDHVTGPILENDAEKLKKRLGERAGGRCVVSMTGSSGLPEGSRGQEQER